MLDFQFLEKSGLFYSFQFGLKAKHSTNHALISITETIKESIDNNNLDAEYFWISRKYLIQSTIRFYSENFSIMV